MSSGSLSASVEVNNVLMQTPMRQMLRLLFVMIAMNMRDERFRGLSIASSGR